MSDDEPPDPEPDEPSDDAPGPTVVERARDHLAQTAGLSIDDAAWLLDSVSQKRRIALTALASAVMDLAEGRPVAAPGADRTHQVAGWVLALAALSGARRRS